MTMTSPPVNGAGKKTLLIDIVPRNCIAILITFDCIINVSKIVDCA